MSNTPATMKPGNSHRVTRLMRCLLLGVLVWLVADYWLDLKPRWTLNYDSRDTVVLPFHEDESGRYVVAGEWKKNKESQQDPEPVSLLILDSATGRTLHQMASTTHSAYPGGYSSVSDLPRWRQGEVWRFASTWVHPDVEETELRVWKPGQLSEQILKRWKAVAPFSISYHWPERSPILVTEIRCCWQAAFLCGQTVLPPFLISLLMMDPRIIHWQPSLYQTWLVPEHSPDPLRLLASWVCFEANDYCSVSPDGEMIAITCGTILNNHAAINRAKQSGLEQLGANEIVNCCVIGNKGVRLYQSRTGKSIKEMAPPRGAHSISASWIGSHLIISNLVVTQSTPVSLTDFSDTNHPIAKHNIFYRYSMSANSVYGPDGTRMELPAPISDNLEDDEGQIAAKVHDYYEGTSDDFVKWYLLQPQGNRLIIEKECDIRSQNDVVMHHSLHLIINEHNYPEAPSWLKDWAKHSKWLESYLERNWPYERNDTTIKNLTDGRELYRWKSSRAMIGRQCPSRRSLFTLELLENPSDIFLPYVRTLHCYALPLNIYSPWWGRGAGLVVAVGVFLLLTYLRRLRRLEVILTGSSAPSSA